MSPQTDPTAIELISEHACFGGRVVFYRHSSRVNRCAMRFSVFLPKGSDNRPLAMLTYLAGLTCTDETFMIKAGAQRTAAEAGLMLVAPDTSPRGAGIPGEDKDWDFGVGAGFYLDATAEPWSRHYNMYSYVTKELPAAIAANFPADLSRQGIFGHSMGGHGALTIGLKHPETYRSISAFAPIASPMRCPWGVKAFSNYLGPDREAWRDYDATELMKRAAPGRELLVDQGLADKFLAEQLKPELLEEAAAATGHALTLRRHAGYDHSYYFIATFMNDHIAHHARILA